MRSRFETIVMLLFIGLALMLTIPAFLFSLYWEHFAGIVISGGLLGMLVLLRYLSRRELAKRNALHDARWVVLICGLCSVYLAVDQLIESQAPSGTGRWSWMMVPLYETFGSFGPAMLWVMLASYCFYVYAVKMNDTTKTEASRYPKTGTASDNKS